MSPPPAPRFSRGTPWGDAEFVSVDLELTGLDEHRDQIVSFGAVPIRRGRIEMPEAVYVEVRPSIASSMAAVTIHQLRTQDLEGKRTLDEEQASLSTAIGGRFMLAWAAGIEVAFLRRTFGGSERSWRRRTIDVRELARMLGDDERSSLSQTAERFGVPLEDPHHALGDALMTAQLFLVIVERMSARSPRSAVRSLVRASWKRR